MKWQIFLLCFQKKCDSTEFVIKNTYFRHPLLKFNVYCHTKVFRNKRIQMESNYLNPY